MKKIIFSVVFIFAVIFIVVGCNKAEMKQVNDNISQNVTVESSKIDGTWQPQEDILGFSTSNFIIKFNNGVVTVFNSKSNTSVFKGPYYIDSNNNSITLILTECNTKYKDLFKNSEKVAIKYSLNNNSLKLTYKNTSLNLTRKI